MRILLLTFYYPPDLCAGAFRSAQLVPALQQQLPQNAHIDIITTQPHRYSSYRPNALNVEQHPGLTIYRVAIPAVANNWLGQMRTFTRYARGAIKQVRNTDYQLVFGTSSRLLTATLGAYIACKKKCPFYFDSRDIFVDTIGDVLPKPITKPVTSIFSLLERWTVKQAAVVNLVSAGFKPYYQARYPKKEYRYFTNCIPAELIQPPTAIASQPSQPITVLYAGNIGVGQGLHNIIPLLAKQLQQRVRFRIIGDGNSKPILQQNLAASSCDNVELLAPLPRPQLLAEYQRADVLLVHLNDVDAFKKVLPSKLFEYAATGKPIWAGVAGYAADFVVQEIDNAAIFAPCNVEQAVSALDQLALSPVKRTAFIEQFSCQSVMRKMAADIIYVAHI